MHKRSALLLFYFLLFTFHFGFSQQFGGNPSSVKWKQINTDTLRVIYPEGLDSAAQRVANVTHTLQHNYTTGIGAKIKKINIVLQKDVTVSNAFVQLGPYRSEYYLMPPQDAFDLGAQGWIDNLAIHEYRHVQQYSNFNVGLSKVFSVLFGQYGEALANSAAVPDWFFEGDAVYNETKYSIQGRGRLPLFLNSYKSLYVDNRHYSYMQMRNGSLQHYIPGHYELGYLLNAYGKEKYGEDFWQKITHDAASYKPLFYPMQGALKKYAGISYDKFVKNAFEFYQQQWQKDNGLSKPEWITDTKKNDVINYQYPYSTQNGSTIVLKTTRAIIPAFYKIDAKGNETKIAVRDIAYDDYFSYNNGKIIYAVLEPDSRWGNRDYSVIKMLDINTGKEKKISHHTKYFSPDISHDGKTIAAVEFLPEQKSKLILFTADGSILHTTNAESGHVFSYPKFSADDKSIFVIDRNARGEMALLKKTVDEDALTILVPYANRIIGFPLVKGDTLFYTCSNNSRDEIFAYINAIQKNYRLASYTTGLYQASTNTNGELISTVFTSNGYRLAKFQPQWQEVNIDSDTLTPQYVTKPFSATDNDLLTNLSSRTFATKKYPKLYNPFNFHSWVPSYSDPDYSFTVYGENVLNTLQSQLYYTYNSNEKYHQAGFTSVFGGWYIQPYIDINKTFNRSGVVNDSLTVKWNEVLASGGLRLPLILTGGKQYRSLTLSASYNINSIEWKSDTKKLLNDLSYIKASLSYSGQIQKAPKQIYPHWAQSLLLQYRASATNVVAHQFLASGNLYLPGVAKTHSIVLNAAYQSRDTAQQYSYTNSFPYSRGYDAINFPRMFKLGANYHFPIVYPDWGFANIVYFTRIRANVFYDYTDLKSLRYQTHYQLRSYGAEIYFDTKWWNQQPLQFGIRYSRLIDHELVGLQPNQWEFILPITLIN
ncbi:hypothetical protein FRZ67_14495 [Panacibacter ginsenosidivorans]|uniref:Uncharacterized protein n=1 Tax=Panacibacter ginsenosidivorans TaxID=1813871 RepID=A0A5B8VBQ0_9BACT|nr:hypothetical protein [Panacibacter ginsenosidivorans]QEC68455.1 hypothetical protein FRZ67_14495 [Panacibacter ginsenosidivorans]